MTRLVVTLIGLALLAVPTTAQAPAPQDPKQVEEILSRWAKRSAQHAAIVGVLREKLAHQPTKRDFDAVKKEAGFVERLRQAEDVGARIETLEEMAKGLEHEPSRMLVVEGLAGMDDDRARAACGRLLPKLERLGAQVLLLRSLPEVEASARLLVDSFSSETLSSNLRVTLLRELGRRADSSSADHVALLGRIMESDSDPNVRAEAVTAAGKNGDARLKKPLAGLCRSEKHLLTRQRALLAYAQVAGDEALPFLIETARSQKEALAIQASAVLAISRLGGPKAIQALEALGKGHPAEEIRTRAARLAASLRKRTE